MSFGTIILVGGEMTLEDGSVVDSRQRIEGVDSTDSLRKSMATSLMWWQTAVSVVTPLLRSSAEADPFAFILGPRSVLTLKADGSTKRTRLAGLLPGKVGEVEIIRTGIGSDVLDPSYTQVADLRNYANEGMGCVGYRLVKDATPWRFLEGPSYYLNHVGPALRPSVFVDTEQGGEDQQFSSTPHHLDAHRLFGDITTLVLAHTASTESLGHRYCKWVRDGCPAPPEPRYEANEPLDSEAVDPNKYAMPVPIAAEFSITGLVRNGVWTDPRRLESARQLLEARYDLQLGIWDLVDNDTLRQALLSEVPRRPKPRVKAELPQATRQRAQASVDAAKARREATKRANRRSAKFLQPLTELGWQIPSDGGFYTLGIGQKSRRPYLDEPPDYLVSLDLRVNKTLWRLGASTSIYNDVDLPAFAKQLTDQFDAACRQDPSRGEPAYFTELANGKPGWDRPDNAWAPLVEELTRLTPRLAKLFEPFAAECFSLMTKKLKQLDERRGQPLATITIEFPSEVPAKPSGRQKTRGLLGRLLRHD